MAKYLFEAHYTAEGTKGLAREGGSGRREAVTKVVESVGGKLEAFYYAFGDVDAYIILDLPDNVTAAAVSLTAHQSGFIAGKTVVLMSPDDMTRLPRRSWHSGRQATDEMEAAEVRTK